MKKCALCQKELQLAPWEPFCSAQCKNKDLGNWALESYRIPTRPESLEEVEELQKLAEEAMSRGEVD